MKEKAAIAQTLLEMADYLDGITQEPETVRIGVTLEGSELGKEEIIQGIHLVGKRWAHIECVPIETNVKKGIESSGCEKAVHEQMLEMFAEKKIDAAVTMHYSFPIGVATVGRVPVPANGKEIFIATTTGTASSQRQEALVLNTLCGISAAKACGITEPTVGFLNIEGARHAEKTMNTLKNRGYDIHFASSIRAESGPILRGNDLLAGACDVVIADSLTGNIIMKMMSAFQTGGSYEAVGYGYGPGIGQRAENIVCIVSRASGAPVVAQAVKYAADMYRGKVLDVYAKEKKMAEQAGLKDLLEENMERRNDPKNSQIIQCPPEKVATAEITGIEILELDDAVQKLWEKGIYGKTGMGCTGPVILVADEDLDPAAEILRSLRFI